MMAHNVSPHPRSDSRDAATRMQATALALGFTRVEWRAIIALRARYRRHRDLFAPRDIERLRFARWLYQTGRLQS